MLRHRHGRRGGTGGLLGHQGEEYRFASAEAGPVTARFRELLDGIRRGESVDRFGWMRRITEVAPVHA